VLVRAAPDTGADPALEYKVKAAFLLNFAKFTGWPTQALATAEAPLVIATMSDDPVGPIISKALEGKMVNGHPLRVATLGETDDLKHYHVLFLSRAQKAQIDEVLRRLDGAPVLTVGETDDFARRGGMINLMRAGDSFRFQINLKAAEAAGLSISSKLASMATLVKSQNTK